MEYEIKGANLPVVICKLSLIFYIFILLRHRS